MTVTLQSVAAQYGISIAELRQLNPGVSDTQQFNSINDIKMPANWYAENGYNMTDKVEMSSQQVNERAETSTSDRMQQYRDGAADAVKKNDAAKAKFWNSVKSFDFNGALDALGEMFKTGMQANYGRQLEEMQKNAEREQYLKDHPMERGWD